MGDICLECFSEFYYGGPRKTIGTSKKALYTISSCITGIFSAMIPKVPSTSRLVCRRAAVDKGKSIPTPGQDCLP